MDLKNPQIHLYPSKVFFFLNFIPFLSWKLGNNIPDLISRLKFLLSNVFFLTLGKLEISLVYWLETKRNFLKDKDSRTVSALCVLDTFVYSWNHFLSFFWLFPLQHMPLES